MLASRPVLTATSEASRRAPVAKAFGSGESKMPTSGMPMPASCACCCTVFTSQLSAEFVGCVMTRTPIIRLADHFDMASEMNAPVKPTTAANTSSAPRFRSTPCASRMPSKPISRRMTPSSTTTARLVTRNSAIRFILTSLQRQPATIHSLGLYPPGFKAGPGGAWLGHRAVAHTNRKQKTGTILQTTGRGPGSRAAGPRCPP